MRVPPFQRERLSTPAHFLNERVHENFPPPPGKAGTLVSTPRLLGIEQTASTVKR
jgi:hypothetical protein